MANKGFSFLLVLVLGLSISLSAGDSYALSKKFSKSKKVTAFSNIRIAKLNQKIRILTHKIGTKMASLEEAEPALCAYIGEVCTGVGCLSCWLCSRGDTYRCSLQQVQ